MKVRHKYGREFSQAFGGPETEIKTVSFASTCTSAASPVQPLRFKREPDYLNHNNKFAVDLKWA